MLTPVSNVIYDVITKIAVNQHNNDLKERNAKLDPSTEKPKEDNSLKLTKSYDSTTSSTLTEKAKERYGLNAQI
ncbi:hypothetical protein ABW19_dt0208205 [Dactylella cylindrospora]|nr:hypothetical protein ABW19_dt0208205 [Dactylella cylindrospora]